MLLNHKLIVSIFLSLCLLNTHAGVCSVCRAECGCTDASLKCTQPDYRKDLDLKEGLENGQSTNPPLYSMDFLGYQNSDCPCTTIPLTSSCTYDPEYASNNKVLFIGAGINLYQLSAALLRTMGVSETIISKLTKFFGWRSDPLTMCKNNWSKCHVELTDAERVELNTKYHNYYVEVLAAKYNTSKSSDNVTLAFDKIPLGARTAIYSYMIDVGGLNNLILKAGFWDNLLLNDWTKVIANLSGYNTYKQNNESWIMQKAFLPPCTTEYGEFIYVLDASGSIGVQQFGLAKNFMWNLTNSLNVTKEALRVGVVVYCSNAREHLALTDNKAAALESIRNIVYTGGNTATGEGLRVAANMIKTEARSSVPYNVAVITDGHWNWGEPLPAPIKALVDLGVNRYAIGVGVNINPNELLQIAGDTEKVYYVANYSSLMAIKNSLAKKVCYSNQQVKSNETKEVNSTKDQVRYFETAFNKSEGVTVTLTVIDKDASTIDVYYSTKISNPNKYLHDGKAVATDKNTLKISTNGEGAKLLYGTDDKANLYYTMIAKEAVKTKIETKPKAQKVKECADYCTKCDLNGQNCQSCLLGYDLIRDQCVFNQSLIYVAIVLGLLLAASILLICTCFCLRSNAKRGYYMVPITSYP